MSVGLLQIQTAPATESWQVVLSGHQTPSAQASDPHPPQIAPLTFSAVVVETAGAVVDAGTGALVVETTGAPVVEVVLLKQDASRQPGPVQTSSQFLSITSPKVLNPGQTTSNSREQFCDVVVEIT